MIYAQKKIKSAEAYLITNSFNVKYLTKFTGSNGTVLITRNKTFFFTDARYTGTAKKIIPKNYELIITSKLFEEIEKVLKKLKTKTLFFEANNLTYQKHKKLKKTLSKIKLNPQINFIEQFRIIKTTEEIKLITKSQSLNEETFRKAIKLLKPGKTEQQIAWEIEKIGHELGADTISFEPIIAFGSNSGTPHHKNTNKKFKKGDIVLIDMGMKYKGYCSDMTRTFFTATPTPKQLKVYETVLEAQESAIKKIKAGIKGQEVDQVARDIIKKAGFEQNFTHSLGHGIGLEVHEDPYLSTEYKKPILTYTVVTVEPGIYLEKSFGIRIEDMVLVKGKKAENLTQIPKKIEDLIIYK